MDIKLKNILLTALAFVGLLGLVVAMAAMTLQPGSVGLLHLVLFLTGFGGVTLVLSIIASRSGLPPWIHSIRGQLLLISVLVVLLVIINIGFVSYLMFISLHDFWLLLGLIVFAAGLSVIAAWYLARPTARSLHEIIMAVREMEGGNLEARVPVASSDEFGELASAFNAMAGSFKRSLDRERMLEKNRRELVEAVSHDLRNPLASLRAMIESINDGVVTDEETVKRYLATTQTEIEYLTQLVNDLFELSRIDAGLLDLHKEPVSIAEVIDETVILVTPQAAAGQLSISAEAAPDLPPLSADPARLHRLLYNLAQNAVFHTPPGGSVNIAARDLGDAVEVRITDTGEGFEERDLDKIFDKNYWINRGSRRTLGTGLGLSISRGIIEAHGGDIRVASRPGHGSTFTLTLPR